ncbi:hypothetical protein BV898_18672 [Hypsibius exemplaris]|uniref:Uncharacterized protein n=1 Tax=Hypsibius exemplaris TaxID=2072580 RepID=A0A9X6RNR7_HYPEX|nr:hypothetical protein BV898_18672 [Hypsibius exemplaris]
MEDVKPMRKGECLAEGEVHKVFYAEKWYRVIVLEIIEDASLTDIILELYSQNTNRREKRGERQAQILGLVKPTKPNAEQLEPPISKRLVSKRVRSRCQKEWNQKVNFSPDNQSQTRTLIDIFNNGAGSPAPSMTSTTDTNWTPNVIEIKQEYAHIDAGQSSSSIDNAFVIPEDYFPPVEILPVPAVPHQSIFALLPTPEVIPSSDVEWVANLNPPDAPFHQEAPPTTMHQLALFPSFMDHRTSEFFVVHNYRQSSIEQQQQQQQQQQGDHHHRQTPPLLPIDPRHTYNRYGQRTATGAADHSYDQHYSHNNNPHNNHHHLQPSSYPPHGPREPDYDHHEASAPRSRLHPPP